MSLKIVTGGTTGAADGTLVSSGNKITFTAVDTVVDCHVRIDDDGYSADTTFSLPSDGSIQVSFDGGSTWHGWSDNPIAYSTGLGSDIGDLNLAIKLRQHASTASTSGTFTTDGTTTSATVLSDVGSFAAVAGGSTGEIAVSWGAVTNRTRYQVDRATNSGFTTGVTLGVYTSTSTSFTDTGLLGGTTYYYRIKAIGTYLYSDSASYATANAVATVTTVTFNPSADTIIRYYDGTGPWTTIRAASVGTDVYNTSDGFAFAASYASLPLVARGFLAFDTSSIPDGATILSAKVKVWGQAAATGTEGSVYLVSGSQAIPATTADYSSYGSTALSDTHIALTSWSGSGFNEFPLNAAGLATINKTGTTKFCGRHSSDFNVSAPSGDNSANFVSVENATSGHRPVLEVVYG